MGRKYIDLTNRDFIRLLVVKRVGNDKHGHFQWLCLCDCGNLKVVLGKSLRCGDTRSCGCLQKEQVSKAATKHSMHNTPEYRARMDAKSRCDNPNHPQYKDYGGRDIEFCQRWRGPNGFKNFLKDMGRRPGPGYSIERLDNDGDYTPDNCVWATMKEQCGNTRQNQWFKGVSPIGRVYISKNQTEFACTYSLYPQSIGKCLRGRLKQHKGWTFVYTNTKEYKFKRAYHHFNVRRSYGEAET